MTTGRRITHRYDDPLDLVWLAAARELGWTVRRSDEAYASFDGAGTLTITTPEAFDPDDCLAQMILHEICHALVAGPERAARADFGLETADDRDLVQEHATHRLQAHLAQRWGLRELFAVTTDWRPYWDRLPLHPLGDGNDPAIPLARAGLARAERHPFAGALRRAFAATRRIVEATLPFAPPHSLLLRARRGLAHPVGGLAGPSDGTCGTCAWFERHTDLEGCCVAHLDLDGASRRTRAALGACTRWEPRLAPADCLDCGACCREAFDAVPVEASNPLLRSHPEWIRRDLEGFDAYLPRPGGRCVALAPEHPPHRCTVYDARPESCRDFEQGSRNCLEARTRVGLSG
jgi:hypothetical protein